jgi:hypothetical protein
MMITFEPTPVLTVATAVWAIWRLMVWRRSGGDAVREVAIATLFGSSMVILYFTFFPLTIIFYDWHGRFNLVPFASIIQLIRDTPIETATENIAGNLLLFVPLGVASRAVHTTAISCTPPLAVGSHFACSRGNPDAHRCPSSRHR